MEVGGSGKDPKKRVTNRLIAGFKEEWSKLEPDDRDKSPWSYLRIKQSKTPSSKEAAEEGPQKVIFMATRKDQFESCTVKELRGLHATLYQEDKD